MGTRDIPTSLPVRDNGHGVQLWLKIAIVLNLARYLTTCAPHSPLVISVRLWSVLPPLALQAQCTLEPV